MFQSLSPKNVLCHHAEAADIKVRAEADAVAEAAAIKAIVLHHQLVHLHQAVERAQAQADAVKAEVAELVADVQDVRLAAANLNTNLSEGVCKTGNCLGIRPFLLSGFQLQLTETFR